MADICIQPYSPERFSPEMVKKAEEGDAYAQSQLGYCYEKGYGVDKNEIEMIKWYKRACTSGKDMTMIGLGVSPEEIKIRTNAEIKYHIYEKNVNKLVWGYETPGLKYRGEILDASSRNRMYSFFREKPDKSIWLRYERSERSFRDLNLNPNDAYPIIAMSFANSGVEMKIDKTVGLKNDMPLDYTWAIYLKGPNGENAEASVEFDENLMPTFSVTCASADYNTFVAERSLKNQENQYEIGPVRAITELTSMTKTDKDKALRNNTPGARLLQCLYYLAKAESEGFRLELIIEESSRSNGTHNTNYGEAIKECLLKNLALANVYGLLEPESMSQMKRGQNVAITKGEYKGQLAKAEFIIPPTLCPELADQIYNIQITPESCSINMEEQIRYAKRLNDLSINRTDELTKNEWEKIKARDSVLSKRTLLSNKGLDAILSSSDKSLENIQKKPPMEALSGTSEVKRESFKLLEKLAFEQAKKANATKNPEDIRGFRRTVQNAIKANELMIIESLNRQGIEIDHKMNRKIELEVNAVREYLMNTLNSYLQTI